MYLKDMKTGQSGVVVGIKKGHASERRLFEIGLVPGARVEVLSRHPFKGPLLLQVGNCRLALGQGIATMVEVELIPG
ncbi:MAG: ferrous iron transport protein A [Syntrophomonadaceae bacterium]|jgi:ferrous iron transport protein A|nr:ferrous iron transport protein A [Syntrophomonadaceae bacterium]